MSMFGGGLGGIMWFEMVLGFSPAWINKVRYWLLRYWSHDAFLVIRKFKMSIKVIGICYGDARWWFGWYLVVAWGVSMDLVRFQREITLQNQLPTKIRTCQNL